MKRTLLAVSLLCLLPLMAHAQAAVPLPPPEPAQAPTFTPHSGPRVGPIMPGPNAREDLPRSPNTRVLPASREPGIWAADGAKAIHEPIPEIPSLLGVELPFPASALSKADRLPTQMCAYKMGNALAINNHLDDAMRLPPNVRRCLAAMLYEHCASYSRATYKDITTQTNVVTKSVYERVTATDRTAKEFMKKACSGVPLSEEVKDMTREAAWLFEREVEMP